MTIKAILFDMDGVLIEAKEWHYESLNKALELFGMPIARYEHLSYFDGLPTLRKLEMLSADGELPEQLHSFLNEMKQQYTMDLIQVQCKPRFVHEYALSQLKARGYQIAVCSNSIRKTVLTMLEKAGLINYIDLIVSNEDVEKSKPDPEMYKKAMEHFNLMAKECLILEDNENGIRAARESGGHLLIIKNVLETNFENIIIKINEINLSNKTELSNGN